MGSQHVLHGNVPHVSVLPSLFPILHTEHNSGLNKTGCGTGVLKLYSHGPINETTYTRSHLQKFRELFKANTKLLSGSAWSVCYYLYLIALEGLRSQEHSRDAHSQIFSLPPRGLSSFVSGSNDRLPGSKRTWNLFCRLGKSADGRNVLSRPWISLQSSPSLISSWCRVGTGDQAPQNMALFLTIAGSLKAIPHQTSNHADKIEHPQGSAFQSIADDLAMQCKHVLIGQKGLTSPGAVMAVIRQRLLLHLPSSPIAAALDLNHLGVTLQFGLTRKRLVQNILLNDDGSVKSNLEMPRSLPARESNSAIDNLSDNSQQPNFLPLMSMQAEHNETAQYEQEASELTKPTGHTTWQSLRTQARPSETAQYEQKASESTKPTGYPSWEL